jgi:hypothetical protein
MSRNVYEGVANILKFVYMALAALIAICGAQWLRADRSERRRAIRETPDTQSVGELVVVGGASAQLALEQSIELPREGTIGRSRSCDVCVRHRDMPLRAAQIELGSEGVIFSPSRWENLTVNGRVYDKSVAVVNGSRLQWGDLTLRLLIKEGATDMVSARGDYGVPVALPPIRRVRKERAEPDAGQADSSRNMTRSPRKRVLRTLDVSPREDDSRRDRQFHEDS